MQRFYHAYPGLFFLFNIFHNVANLAFKDSAKHFNGVCANTFIPFQAGDLPGTDAVMLDKHILRHPSFFHHSPELVIGNHKYHHPIDIITEFGI